MLISVEHKPWISKIIRVAGRHLYNFKRRVAGKEVLYCRNLYEGGLAQIWSDARVVCNCTTDFILGDLRVQGLASIWNGQRIQSIEQTLNKGILPNRNCFHCQQLAKLPHLSGRPERKAFPKTIFFEICSLCNMHCRTCFQKERTAGRKIRLMEEDFAYRILDDICKPPELRFLAFLGFGEPFIHPAANSLIAYAKRIRPDLIVTTSTNGLLLDTEEKCMELAHAGLDRITFSIDGGTPQTYAIYNQGGDFYKVLNNMEQLVKAKQRCGQTTPIVQWSYILFKWNDEASVINKALELAESIGVDLFKIMHTRNPFLGRSTRWPEAVYKKNEKGKFIRLEVKT